MPCYICGYELEGETVDFEGNDVHADCYADSVAPHYHLWLVADNGYNVGKDGATAIYRRAPRFKSREQAMRAASTRYGRDRSEAMAMICECKKGVKAIVPKA